jgi:hypothetical protein
MASISDNLGFPAYGPGECAGGSFPGHANSPFLETHGRGHNKCNQGASTSNQGSSTNLGTNAGGNVHTNQVQWGAPAVVASPLGISCVASRKGQPWGRNWFCTSDTELTQEANIMIDRGHALPQSVLMAQQTVSDINMHQ